MTYDWEPYKEVCHRVCVEEKQSLRKLHAYLKNNHGFEPSLRGLHRRLKQWNFPAKHSPAYKNEALVARIKELWETNHQVRDMITILTDEGFDIQEREINRIRQKNGWLLRVDVAHPNKKKKHTKGKRPAAQATSPESDSEDSQSSEEEGEDNQENSTTTPNFEPVTPSAALADLDYTQAQAEAFQEARKRALAADAEERRVTKKRRRWLKGRAGLPADPPGPPRFPSELSLTECKAVLAMDTAVYKDVRAKFRKICEAEGIVKKTIAGPQKWEAVKLQLVRESMHLRGVFWDQLNMEQKNLALDLICGDVTKGIRSEASRMMLHEARNILGLNPKLGREVRFHFQKILAEDRFKGKIVAGEEHWNDLVRRWLAESEVLGPVATSLNELDPEYAKKKKAVQCIASDAMKRFRDAELRGTLGKMLAQSLEDEEEHDEQDAHGEMDHDAGGNGNTTMDVSGFDDSVFGPEEAALMAAHRADHGQGSDPTQPTGNQGQSETPASAKRKPGRPRKHPYPDAVPEGSEPPAKKPRGRPRKRPPPDAPPEGSDPPAKKPRGRKSNRIPEDEALAIYAHSQARFLPPVVAPGQGSNPGQGSTPSQGARVPIDPALTGTFAAQSQPVNPTPQYMPTPTLAPVSGAAASPAQAHVSATDSPLFLAPAQSRTQTEAQDQTQARARAQVQAQAQVQGFIPAPLHASSPAPSYTATTTSAQALTSAQPYRAPTAIYFRLNPASTVTGLPGMWIATLMSRSVEELRSKASSKSPGAVCMAVDGIVRDGLGGEVPIPIPGNTELEAYLDHMAEVHGPPTFSVQLINVP